MRTSYPSNRDVWKCCFQIHARRKIPAPESQPLREKQVENKRLQELRLCVRIKRKTCEKRGKYKIQKEEDRVLYLKRIDKEFVDNNINDYMPVNIETHDWPTYGHGYRKVFWVESFFSVLKHLAKAIHVNSQYIIRLDDLKRFYFYRPFYVQLGVNFLCPYSKIYTTRLHVMILGLLLGKKLVLINNSSGKIWNYYETWLKEIDSIELFRKK